MLIETSLADIPLGLGVLSIDIVIAALALLLNTVVTHRSLLYFRNGDD